MAGRLGTLTLDLIAKIGGFTGPLEKASKQSKKTADDISSAGKAIGIGIGAGAAAAAVGLTLMVKSQMDAIGAQVDLASKLRTTYGSLETLARAGDLAGVSMQQIEAAAGKLELNLGKAAQGSKAQSEALAQLGLNASEVAALPLDERILKINAALAKNVPAAQRAAVAAELFGAKNATAMGLLDTDTLAEAARQVEIFGLNLSEVDAAKVEMAGDALSNFSLLADGIGTQLTVELAPVLKAIGDQFLESAEKAGGLGTVVQDTVKTSVNVLSFLADAADGVGRVFEIVADTIIGTITTAAGYATDAIADVVEALQTIPGVDLSGNAESIRQFSQESFSVAQEAAANIKETLERPLAGTAFKQFYEDAQKAGQASAEAAESTKGSAEVVARAMGTVDKAAAKAERQLQKTFESTAEGLERQIALFGQSGEAAQLAYEIQSGKLVGINAEQQKRLEGLAAELDSLEKIKEQQEGYAGLVRDMRADEEVRNDQLRERLKIIESMPGLLPGERTKQTGRAIDAAFPDAPDSGVSEIDAGPLGELGKLDDSQQELEEWYSTQLQLLDGYRKDRSDLNTQWDEQELELKRQYEEQLAGIESSRWKVGLSGMSDFLTQIQTLRDTDSKKGKQLAKTAAIAQATINAYTAATGAYASASAIPVVGWVMGPIAAAAALAAGLANVSAIKGMAHDGIDSVPEDGTWLLQKGERVTTAETSAKLDNTLAKVQAGMAARSGGAVSQPMNITINQPGVTNAREARESSAAVQRAVARAVSGSRRYI